MVQPEGKAETALVLGLGVSGYAAAGLLRREGAGVIVADAADRGVVTERADRLRRAGCSVLLGPQALSRALAEGPEAAFAVVSPGFAPDSEWLKTLAERGVQVISELELGASRCSCPMLAVTGTNGKSSAVTLCVAAMQRAGLKAVAAGNIGSPLCEAAEAGTDLDAVVVEVSSFQLETVREFHPRAAILLNIQPDHLDRHGSMEAYRALKVKLFADMNPQDTAVLPVREKSWLSGACPGSGRRVWFGASEEADARYADGEVRFRGRLQGTAVNLRGTRFHNDVLGPQAAAVGAGLLAWGVPSDAFERAVREFVPLPHRMQDVADIRGVRFVNDSKATNLAALKAALQMSSGPMRLIAGGRRKQNNLSSVKECLAKRVRAVYVIGESAGEMAAAWRDTVPCVCCTDLADAVHRAWREAGDGETILLSPGCASFDQFRNFEDRGHRFMALVKAIQEEA